MPTPPLPEPRAGIRVVRNQRAGADWNTCAQAAIATVLVARGMAPYPALDDAAAIDRVRIRFGADLPFGLGTSAARLVAALRADGLAARAIHSGLGGRGLARVIAAVRTTLERGTPVPVCVDDGLLGGTHWGAHWAVLLGVRGGQVVLGNVGGDGLMSWDRFERAWRCRHLPWGHNHAAILAGDGAAVGGR